MEAKYKSGLKRFNDRYPDYNGCTWKSIAEDSRPTTEGKLKDCLDCDGLSRSCNNYVTRR